MTTCSAAGNGYLSGGRYRGLASESDVVLIRAKDEDEDRDGRASHQRARYSWASPGARHPRDVDLARARPRRPARARRRARGRCGARGRSRRRRRGWQHGAGIARPPRLHPPRARSRSGGFDDANTPEPEDNAPWPSSHGEVRPGVFKPDLLAPSVWVPAPMVPGTLRKRARPTRLYADLLDGARGDVAP